MANIFWGVWIDWRFCSFLSWKNYKFNKIVRSNEQKQLWDSFYVMTPFLFLLQIMLEHHFVAVFWRPKKASLVNDLRKRRLVELDFFRLQRLPKKGILLNFVVDCTNRTFKLCAITVHSGQCPKQNLFGHSLILKLFWTFWMLLDIERSFIRARAILEQNWHTQTGQ